MFQIPDPKEQLVVIMKRIYAQGMTTTSGGNLSIKDENGNVYITPGGTDKGSMTAEDIVCIRADGTMEGKHKPSSEYPFHMKIYETRGDIRAILHAHPPAMVAYSIVRKIPDISAFPELKACIGSVGMAEYGLTGSEELGEKIAKVFAEGCNIAELENHGLVVGSTDIESAYQVFEAMDFSARIGIGASRLGGAKNENPSGKGLTDENMEKPKDPSTEIPQEDRAVCEKLCEMVRRAWHQKLLYAGLGVFSARAESGTIYYIPQGTDQSAAGILDIRKLEQTGDSLHAKIYRTHPGIGSVVTAFPPELMAFAVTGTKFSSRIIPEIYMVMQDVVSLPQVQYAGKPDEIAAVFDGRTSVAVLEGGGVIVTAPSLLKAYDRLEVAEYSARAILESSQLGNIVEITEKQVDEIRVQCHLN
jgi:L-fuculose-phosphate aldolase